MLDQNTKALLPKLIQDAMEALTNNTNAPDELTLPVTLAVASFVTQALTNVDCMQWPKTTLSEYFCVLVPSGGMKTSVMDSLLEGARRYERDQKDQADQDQTDYLIELKKYEAAIKEEVKNPTGAKITKPVVPRGWRYLFSKCTTNGLIDTLVDVPYAGLFSSDAGEFFNSHSFSDPNKSVEIVSTLSKAWSGEDIDRVTGVTENNVQLRNKRLTMLVLLQQELAGFLNNSAFKDQGFTNRMLITQCELYAKKKADFSDDGQQETDANTARLQPFNDHIYQLLQTVDQNQQMVRYGHKGNSLRALQASMGHTKINELELTRLTFSKADGSRKEMENFYNEMAVSAMDPQYAEYANFMSRVYEHACRLAATLTVFEGKKEITLQEVQCAIGLIRYFIDQRMNLNVDGIIRENPIVACGEAVIKWMLKQIDGETSKQELVQYGPSAFRKMVAEDRSRVIADLEARELVEVISVAGLGTKPKHLLKVAKAPKIE